VAALPPKDERASTRDGGQGEGKPGADACVSPLELGRTPGHRDGRREAELTSALKSGPSTAWVAAMSAIATGEYALAVELIAGLGAPPVEAYTRLRAAEEFMRAGAHEQAHKHLEPAVAFFKRVGATRYLARGEQLLASA
jgi:hypothetical protein